jgi:hypothetical protein
MASDTPSASALLEAYPPAGVKIVGAQPPMPSGSLRVHVEAWAKAPRAPGPRPHARPRRVFGDAAAIRRTAGIHRSQIGRILAAITMARRHRARARRRLREHRRPTVAHSMRGGALDRRSRSNRARSRKSRVPFPLWTRPQVSVELSVASAKLHVKRRSGWRPAFTGLLSPCSHVQREGVPARRRRPPIEQLRLGRAR